MVCWTLTISEITAHGVLDLDHHLLICEISAHGVMAFKKFVMILNEI